MTYLLLQVAKETIAALTTERDRLENEVCTARDHLPIDTPDDESLSVGIIKLRDQVSTLTTENTRLAYQLRNSVTDFCETDTAIRDALRPILGDVVDGDANGVPPLEDVVAMLVEREYGMQNVLQMIASYGHDGLCPFGCDCPNIAQGALEIL